MLFIALMLSAAASFPNAAWSRPEEPQQKKAPAAAAAPADEQEPEYSEDEYYAYDTASKEADLEKRATMLLEFMQKYPKSKLMTYADSSYKSLLFEASQKKAYDKLEPLAEKWLKLHPSDVQTIAYIAEAAEALGHDEKCVQCLLELYQMQPTGSMAYNIAKFYQKMKNQPKVEEWANKIFSYPEYDGDYKLRAELFTYYVEQKNLPKASGYAQLTLKAIGVAKPADAAEQDQMKKVRRVCYHIIGLNLYDQDKYEEAIKNFRSALKVEKSGDDYYYWAMSLWKQKKVEEAIDMFARAEQQGGDMKAQSKDKLEQLYKSIHNDTIIGIDKVYRRAKEIPAE
jgi:tetratricopeptide (TPR) repeat protein